MSRRKESGTPIVEKSQNSALLDGKKTGKENPRSESQDSLSRPSEAVLSEAKAQAESAEQAIIDTPMKQEADAEPEVQVNSTAVDVTKPVLSNGDSQEKSSVPAQPVAPEVTNVLSSLQQMQAKQEPTKP